MKKKILILTFTDLTSDARIQRQIKALGNEFELIVCAKKADKEYKDFIPSVDFRTNYFSLLVLTRLILVPVVWLIRVWGWERFDNEFVNWLRYWSVKRIALYNKLKKNHFDLVIANDLDTLPIAVLLKNRKKIPLIFDAHEYYPKQHNQNEDWVLKEQPFINHLCYKYLKEANTIFTVSQGLINEYKKTFNVSALLLSNAHSFMPILTPSSVQKENIKIVHMGGAIRGRKIERMIEVARLLAENYTFDFYLIPVQHSYYEELKFEASKLNNVRILPPLKLNELVYKLNEYDIGVYILEPNSFNNKHALPNKLFEFIQARLAIAIGPSPEMKSIVEKYNIGVVSDDFTPESLAKAIKRVTIQELIEYKKNTERAAKELNAEKNAEVLINEVQKLLKNNA
ncbi:MAG: glycosyltransferase [bacterium]